MKLFYERISLGLDTVEPYCHGCLPDALNDQRVKERPKFVATVNSEHVTRYVTRDYGHFFPAVHKNFFGLHCVVLGRVAAEKINFSTVKRN